MVISLPRYLKVWHRPKSRFLKIVAQCWSIWSQMNDWKLKKKSFFTNVARSEIVWSEAGIHASELIGLRPSGAWIPSLRFFDRSSLVKKKVSAMPFPASASGTGIPSYKTCIIWIFICIGICAYHYLPYCQNLKNDPRVRYKRISRKWSSGSKKYLVSR